MNQNLPGCFQENSITVCQPNGNNKFKEIWISLYPIIMLKSIQATIYVSKCILDFSLDFALRLLRMKSTKRMMKFMEFIIEHLGLIGLVILVYQVIRQYRMLKMTDLSRKRASRDILDENVRRGKKIGLQGGLGQTSRKLLSNLSRQNQDDESRLSPQKQDASEIPIYGDEYADSVAVTNTPKNLTAVTSQDVSALPVDTVDNNAMKLSYNNDFTNTPTKSGSKKSTSTLELTFKNQYDHSISSIESTFTNDNSGPALCKVGSLSTLESSNFSTDLESDDEFECLARFDFGTFSLSKLDTSRFSVDSASSSHAENYKNSGNGDIAVSDRITNASNSRIANNGMNNIFGWNAAIDRDYVNARDAITDEEFSVLNYYDQEANIKLHRNNSYDIVDTFQRKLIQENDGATTPKRIDVDIQDVPRDSGVEIREEHGIPSSIAYHSNQELISVPFVAAYTRQLLLNDNKISAISSAAFVGLHSLTLLNLCGNSIQALPVEITLLNSLEFLYLRKNLLKEV